MLIIGLVGGTEARRERLAGLAQTASKAPLPAYAMYAPNAGPARAAMLADVILSFSENDAPPGALVLVHVRTREEADLIRARRGFLWHLQGAPSAEVPILRHDLMVTERPGGDRHFLDAAEALSETHIRYAAA